MAKMSIDEFNKKLSEKLGDNEDLAIELMEDATDSFKSADKEMQEMINNKDAELKRVTDELADLKTKYKDRFLTPASADVVSEIKEENPVGLQEKEVIDIRVI